MKYFRRQRGSPTAVTKIGAATGQAIETPDKKVQPLLFHSLRPWVIAFLLVLLGLSSRLNAQPNSTDSLQLRTTYLFAGIGGFLPLTDSYRLNYSTRLAGIPLELNGGFLFPISHDVLAPVTVRYVRRVANFIDATDIKVLSLEPGVRFYLEKETLNELRVFGGVEGLLAQASVASVYDVSSNGEVTGQAAAGKDYFNFGIGFDLGVQYPLTPTTSLDGTVHTSIYVANAVSHGGLGNIGGVSLTAAYRFGF